MCVLCRLLLTLCRFAGISVGCMRSFLGLVYVFTGFVQVSRRVRRFTVPNTVLNACNHSLVINPMKGVRNKTPIKRGSA